MIDLTRDAEFVDQIVLGAADTTIIDDAIAYFALLDLFGLLRLNQTLLVEEWINHIV